MKIQLRTKIFSEADRHADYMNSLSASLGIYFADPLQAARNAMLPRDRLAPGELSARLERAVDITNFITCYTGPEGRFLARMWTETKIVSRSVAAPSRFFERLAAFHIVELTEEELIARTITLAEAIERHSERVHTAAAPGHPYQIRLSPGWVNVDTPDPAGMKFVFKGEGNAVFGIQPLPSPGNGIPARSGPAIRALEGLLKRLYPQREATPSYLVTVAEDGSVTFSSTLKNDPPFWKATYAAGSGGSYFVYGWADADHRELLNHAFADIDLGLPNPETVALAATQRLADYEGAADGETPMEIGGPDVGYKGRLCGEWTLFGSEHSTRKYLFRDELSLTMEITHITNPIALETAYYLAYADMGFDNTEELSRAPKQSLSMDDRTWTVWEMATGEGASRAEWLLGFQADLEGSLMVVAQRAAQPPRLARLSRRIIINGLQSIIVNPIQRVTYRGKSMDYSCNLPPFWQPDDQDYPGIDRLWKGPGEMGLRIEAVEGAFDPAERADTIESIRFNLSELYEVGESVESGDWTRFQVTGTLEKKPITIRYSVKVAEGRLCVASVLWPTEKFALFEKYGADALDSVEFR